MEYANRKQTIFNSKPLGVTAWIFLANSALKLLVTENRLDVLANGLAQELLPHRHRPLGSLLAFGPSGASPPLLASPPSGSRCSPSRHK
jgi:hypothetical protein